MKEDIFLTWIDKHIARLEKEIKFREFRKTVPFNSLPTDTTVLTDRMYHARRIRLVYREAQGYPPQVKDNPFYQNLLQNVCF